MTATPKPAHAEGGACRNCGSMLQGRWCHVCGQHAHNPLRSFRHALEDVFESFWHLDGRIFRSLRDLLRPGRIARNYLDGQRVRYLPPLRLYVILSVITFFVAHFVAMGLKGGFAVDVRDRNDSPFLAETTVEGVKARRDALHAEIEADRREAAAVPGVGGALDRAQAALDAQAGRRIAELTGQPLPSLPADTVPAEPQARVLGGRTLGSEGSLLRRLSQDWQRNAERNFHQFAQDRRAFVERMITHVPSVLLMLVPLFALVLRLLYLLRPMGYLEHLVVSLYSHSFLLLAALAWMLAMLLDRAIGSSVLSSVAGTAFWIGTPLYLLFAQKRIYADGWPLTLLRWLLAGGAWSMLALLAFTVAVAMSFAGRG